MVTNGPTNQSYSCSDRGFFTYGNLSFSLDCKPDEPMGYVQLKGNEVLILPQSLLIEENLRQFNSDTRYRELYWREMCWVRLGARYCDADLDFRNNEDPKDIVEKVVSSMTSYPDYEKIFLDLKQELILDRVQPFYQRWYRRLRRALWRR